MNRELKFRAWDAKNKKFAFVGFHIMGEVTAFDLLAQYSLEEGIKLEITQWTGLCDKAGNDVYVGDIYMDTLEKFVVEYGEYDFEGLRYYGIYSKMLNEKYNNYSSPLSLEDSGVIEVIGNIYQTAEDNGGGNI